MESLLGMLLLSLTPKERESKRAISAYMYSGLKPGSYTISMCTGHVDRVLEYRELFGIGLV